MSRLDELEAQAVNLGMRRDSVSWSGSIGKTYLVCYKDLQGRWWTAKVFNGNGQSRMFSDEESVIEHVLAVANVRMM